MGNFVMIVIIALLSVLRIITIVNNIAIITSIVVIIITVFLIMTSVNHYCWAYHLSIRWYLSGLFPTPKIQEVEIDK